MKQILTHWTDESFKDKMITGILEFREFPPEVNIIKPIGFWLSVDGSWERWLDGSWEEWLVGKICLKATLSEDINLFIIESKEQFLKEFKELTGVEYNGFFSGNDIFHEKLKEKYDGIWLKAKPFYAHRLDMDFIYFYTWDCESICVWNKDKIKFEEDKK